MCWHDRWFTAFYAEINIILVIWGNDSDCVWAKFPFFFFLFVENFSERGTCLYLLWWILIENWRHAEVCMSPNLFQVEESSSVLVPMLINARKDQSYKNMPWIFLKILTLVSRLQKCWFHRSGVGSRGSIYIFKSSSFHFDMQPRIRTIGMEQF